MNYCKEHNLRKNKGLFLFFFFMVISLSSVSIIGQASSYEETVQNVKEKLGVSEQVAEAFLKYVDSFVTNVQNNFTNIASHNTDISYKRKLITETLESYFADPMLSEVQVSSLNTRKVRSYPIQAYLERLSKLSQTRYQTVKLLFDQTYFSMGPIESYQHEDIYHFRGSGSSGRAYEFKLDMWQLFEGCWQDGKRCYRDFTKKGFHITFMPSRDGWKMRIFAITADKPLRANQGDQPYDWKNKFQ